jgi:hypothetical protein
LKNATNDTVFLPAKYLNKTFQWEDYGSDELMNNNSDSKELAALKKRLDKAEAEVGRIDKMEKSLAYHELVLTKKVSDIYVIEKSLEDLVNKRELAWVREELKKFDKHEALLFENSKFIREIINEMNKLKEAHRLSKQQVAAKQHVEKSECEERHGEIKSVFAEFEKIRNAHSGKVGKEELLTIRKELEEKMNQIEYQNKILMKYLKKVDEHVMKPKK